MRKKSTGIKPTRNRPGETTESIKKFFKDINGIFNIGDVVKFQINKGPIEEGIIMDFKKHLEDAGRGKVDDELAKVKCINTTRKKPICYVFFREFI